MISLYDELKMLVAELNRENVPYALCGGVAMAVHGYPRATVDLDLLVLPADLDRVASLAGGLGYRFAAVPMEFSSGTVQIRRISKMAGEDQDPWVLDLVLATGVLLPLFEGRQQLPWADGTLWVLSRDGMIQMKSLRGSEQDRADIAALKGQPDEAS
ncbi:MAG: hypothetical protein ACRD3A_04360 [Terriglobales bacterium]